MSGHFFPGMGHIINKHIKRTRKSVSFIIKPCILIVVGWHNLDINRDYNRPPFLISHGKFLP